MRLAAEATTSAATRQKTAQACHPGRDGECRTRVAANGLPISARRKADTFVQHALAGHVIELEPYARGIFKQERIVARRPRAFLRRTDDGDVLGLEKRMRAIDVLPAAAAEAHVMQPDASLDEALARIRRVAAIDADGSPSSHVINEILACQHLL